MAGWTMDGAGFKEWRQRMQLTQAEAADKFQVTRVTIQNWESSQAPLQIIIQQGCSIWERRIKQTCPDFGPVRLAYSDGPWFAPANGRSGTMQIFEYPDNAAALQVVRQRWGDPDFNSPFIMYGEPAVDLWNANELSRVASGADTEAP